MPKELAKHHKDAETHHQNAAKHHNEAAKNHEMGNHEKGAHHAQVAEGHAIHAKEASKNASKRHTELHGKK